MASGKTEELILLSRSFKWYEKTERPQRERDRTLSGKARIRARKKARG